MIAGGPHPPSFGECGAAANLHSLGGSLVRRPLRFNFHAAFLVQRIVTKAAPLPVFGPFHQSTLNRISMDVLQLFDELSLAGLFICKVWEPVVTGEGHKMRLPRVMEALEPTWHENQFGEKLAV
jgi:hypothetical protein